MSDFVLTRLDGQGWQGSVGVDITVEVHSDTASVVMEGAVCSSSTPADLPVDNGKVVFQLVKGAQALTVTIQRIAPPFADWQAVEVDAGGNSQALAAVFVDDDPADPFSLNINLRGV